MKTYSVFVVSDNNRNTLVDKGLGMVEAKNIVDGINYELSSRGKDKNKKAVLRREKDD